MIRQLKKLIGYTLQASDGEIGRCDDFLFDDEKWAIRYMVADTSKWLPGREVIISPVFLDRPDWEEKNVPVRLTRQQIKDSPPLIEKTPVSRRYEMLYYQHYRLPQYWSGGNLWGGYQDPYGTVYPIEVEPIPKEELQKAEQIHLRSVNEVIKYHISTTDGQAGHVEDFLIDDETLAIRYLVIDTRNWLPGKKVLLSPAWLKSISWEEQKVHVDLDSDTIRNCPEYDASKPVTREYEIALFDYYARSYYWD
ncbi:MAG: PRC-barrel domain-containing protein [Thioalkalispiraceae bacterium]|jgi:hypothetical protein